MGNYITQHLLVVNKCKMMSLGHLTEKGKVCYFGQYHDCRPQAMSERSNL